MVLQVFRLLLDAKSLLLQEGYFFYHVLSDCSLPLSLIELSIAFFTLTRAALLLLSLSRYY